MENENLQRNEQIDEAMTVDTSQMYLDQIKNLKNNTVSKDDYNKILNENRNLLQTIVEGGSYIDNTSTEVVRPLDDIRKDLFNPNNDNLTYCKTALELRTATLKASNGKDDIFVPHGYNIVPDENDYACAERVANTLQDCIDYADGDSMVFTNELQRRLVDNIPQRRK